ncbi:MAG TPA: hypothetical protein VKA68_15265 [bacterium]|nr:hypothetical protein [bacterium]
MKCGIGVTRDPSEKKEQLKEQYAGFANWEILGEYSMYRAAQKAKFRFAEECECRPQREGLIYDGHTGPWYVYHFEVS